MDVLPEVLSLAEEVLSREKFFEVENVAQNLLGNRTERKWAISKAILEVGLSPYRPLMYWSIEMKGLPRNTRDCIRYLGDYIDLLTKEMTHEFIGGNARKNSLGKNANLLIKQKEPNINVLANLLKKYADFLYTPGKHDFSLPTGRKHRFTPEEVILTCYITANLGRRIKSISNLAVIAIKKDQDYSIGGRWGSSERVQYHGYPTEKV